MSEKQLVLVVDDDPDLVESVTMKLEAADYRTDKAYDGIEALEKIQEEKPAAVVLDVMMPGKNGWKVCEEIKNNDELKDIAVIMLTAVTDFIKTTNYTYHDGKTTMADDYIPKPIDLDSLVEIIGDHLKA